MSQKIEGNTAPLATLRAASIAAKTASGVSGEGKTGAIDALAATDSLRLTGEASGLQTLQRELSAAPAVDSKRVDAVRQALQDGSYKINPDAIASRMLELDQQLGE